MTSPRGRVWWTGMARCVLGIVPLLLAAPLQGQLTVHLYPDDSLFVYELEPGRGLGTVVVQNLVVMNPGTVPLTVDSVLFELRAGGAAVNRVPVRSGALDRAARQLATLGDQGLLALYDFHFQTSRFLRAGTTLARSSRLPPRSAMILSGTPLLVRAAADRLAIIVYGTVHGVRQVTESTTLRLVPPPRADFHFPLRGTWYVAAAPTLESHHRWATNEEFALGLLIVDSVGRTHSGVGSRFMEYYAYGRDVRAAAPGVVVDVATAGVESEDRFRRPHESAEACEQRSAGAQRALLAGGYKGVAGNYVVLRHIGGLYSHYIHLQSGSVRVALGDTVRQDQVIARVGQSGNSDEPHLHFQVTDGPDPMYSRGVPVRFSNLVVAVQGWTDRYLQTG